MAEISVLLTGDEAKLWKAQQRILDQQLKIQTGYDKVGQKGQDASKRASGAATAQAGILGGLVKQLSAVAGGYLSVTGAVNLLTKAYQNQERIATDAANAALKWSVAQANAITNLGDVTDEVAARFVQNVQNLSVRGGLPSAAPALDAAASILSATGGDRAKTLEVLRTAAPFFAGRPEQLPGFGGSIADVMNISQGGSKHAAAFMLSLFGQARFTELGAFQNVTSALATGEVVAPGDRMRSLRETGALIAGIGGRIADPDAAQTNTAVANLMSNLKRVAPDLGSTFERLAKVQADPKLQEEVLRSGFRGAVKPVIEDLLRSGSSQTASQVMGAWKQLAAPEEMVDRKYQQLARLTPQLRAAGFERGALGVQEQFLAGSEMAHVGVVGPRVRQAIADTQRDWMDWPAQMQAQMVQRMASWLGFDPATAGAAGVMTRLGQLTTTGAAGADQERIRLLSGILGELMKMRADMRQGGDTAHRPAALAERSAQRE